MPQLFIPARTSAFKSEGTIITRWNAGVTVSAIDGEMDWTYDASAISGTLSGGSTAATSMDSSVPSTTPIGVFTNDKFATSGDITMTFGGGTLDNATYKVRMYFQETFFQTSGARVFDIDVEGVSFLTDLDLWAANSDRYIGLMREWEGAISDGTINIVIKRGSANNPIIHAVEIIQL